MSSFTTKLFVATALACVGTALVVVASHEPDSAPAAQRSPATSAEAKTSAVATQPVSPRQTALSATQAVEKAALPDNDDDLAPLPSRDVVAHFDAWMAQARAGDIDAARRIVDSLSNCRRAANIRPGAAPDSNAGSSNALRQSLDSDRFQRQCGAYRPEHYARLLEAAESGARAGSDYLRAEYYSLDPLRNGTIEPEQFQKYKDNANAFLRELVDAGNPDGYLLMSDAYAAGRIVARDETTAYAYYLAWQQAGRDDRQPPSATSPRYRNLSADQIRQGQELSRIIQHKDIAP